MVFEGQKVENQVFYHIIRYSQKDLERFVDREWKIGETKRFGKELGVSYKHMDLMGFTYQDPNTGVEHDCYNVLNDVVRCNTVLSKNRKYPFFHYDNLQSLIDSVSTMYHYIFIIRELIFEEVRIRQFPRLPSRKTALYVFPNDPNSIKYWCWTLLDSWNIFSKDEKAGKPWNVIKFSLTGKIHKGSEEYLPIATCGLNFFRDCAVKYWSSVPGKNPYSYEYLFEGNATVLDIIPFEEFKKQNGLEVNYDVLKVLGK